MTLQEGLLWLLGGGGLGWICARLWEWLEAHWPAFQALRPDLKRLAVFAGTALVAMLLGAGAVALASWLGYAELPATPQVWVERLFELAAYAIISGQVTHGERVLRQK